jgi:hypothetical protein
MGEDTKSIIPSLQYSITPSLDRWVTPGEYSFASSDGNPGTNSANNLKTRCEGGNEHDFASFANANPVFQVGGILD